MGEIKFKIVPDCGLSLYEQIKNQIISSLYTGKIKEGDRLPSIRKLSSEAGVNVKTISRVYSKLSQENYLEVIRGKGVFIKKRTSEEFGELRREALLSLFEKTIKKASLLGLSEEKFGELFNKFVGNEKVTPFKCILVDDEEELLAFSEEISRKLDAKIYKILLDEIDKYFVSDNMELNEYKYVLTTSWHIENVSKFATPLGKKVIEIKPNPSIYSEIVSLLKERNIGVIVRDMKTLHTSFDVFMNIFYPSTENKFIITPITNKRLVNEIIEFSDTVFASPYCWDEVRKIMPGDKDLRKFKDFISDKFIEHLKILQIFE